jgi:hypothetical protein
MASKKQKTSHASKLQTDPDLSSPIHDEIQMWAIKNKTALYSKILDIVTTNGRYESIKWIDDKWKAHMKAKSINCEVEYPVTNKLAGGSFGKTIVGYMDVVLYPDDEHLHLKTCTHLSWNTGANLRYSADARYYAPFSFFIEIKSKITSFGEIMRELQFYNHHIDLPPSHIVLLAPCIPFANEIREQGFTVLEYNADLVEAK